MSMQYWNMLYWTSHGLTASLQYITLWLNSQAELGVDIEFIDKNRHFYLIQTVTCEWLSCPARLAQLEKIPSLHRITAISKIFVLKKKKQTCNPTCAFMVCHLWNVSELDRGRERREENVHQICSGQTGPFGYNDNLNVCCFECILILLLKPKQTVHN